MNSLKTVVLMTFMMCLLLAVGAFIGGEQGLVLAFLFSLMMNFGSYWFSDRIVLMMYRAREVTEAEQPRLTGLVARVASEAQLPMPRVYLIASDSPNAFATGRNPEHAAVAATDGILNILSDDELEGVLAHEFAHIRHRDILTGTIVATMVGTITFIARMAGWSLMMGGGDRNRRGSNGFAELLMLIVAPIAALLMQLAISRSREYEADAGGAQITGRPLSLASALEKLERQAGQKPLESASPASAHLFIVNPLRAGGLMKLFSTHPPLEERIARLHQIALGR
ncbi:MAG TPA: zinc metalloprotease HtpX [Bacteroidota bacterium]|nr:zinc metalloprotease HtpX [Bacteroidota bacterium]